MSDPYKGRHPSQTIKSELERAIQYHNAGQLQRAAEIYTKILETNPNHSMALHLLGVVADQSGETSKAIDLIQRALRTNPNDPVCYLNLGLAFQNSGEPKEAISYYQKALQLRPDFAEAHNNVGYALQSLSRSEEAISYYQKALQLKPDFPEAYNNMGNALQSQSRSEEAISCYQKALELRPGFAKAYNNMGSALRSLSRLEEALSCYQKALQLRPDFAEAHNNVGNLFLDEGRVDEAVSSFEKSLEIRPDPGIEVKKCYVLPVISKSQESINECRRRLAKRIEKRMKQELRLHDPSEQVGRPPFYLAYHGLNDKELQQKIASLYIHACPDLAWTSPNLHEGRGSSDRVTVGMISSYLYNHTIGKLNFGIIRNLSREKFCLKLFRFPGKQDQLSQAINEAADEVVVLPPNLKLARQQISEHRLDILFYLDVGMDSLTYFLAFSRLAPVQCVTWGHPVTTGIPNMDYFISCASAEPPGAEEHYSERLVCLSRLNTYYYCPQLPKVSPSREKFGIPEDCNLYVCPQSLFKFHPDFDHILGSILRQDSRALLVLIQGKCKHWMQLLRDRFGSVFPEEMDRVRFLPHMPMDDFLSLLRVADVVLDTICFGGGNTSLEAFACDVPVVTLPSEFLRGRLTLALYKQMGVTDCVAKHAQSYVDIALRLANDRSWRDEIRRRIHTNASLVYEDIEAVRALEHFFQSAVLGRGNWDIAL